MLGSCRHDYRDYGASSSPGQLLLPTRLGTALLLSGDWLRVAKGNGLLSLLLDKASVYNKLTLSFADSRCQSSYTITQEEHAPFYAQLLDRISVNQTLRSTPLTQFSTSIKDKR